MHVRKIVRSATLLALTAALVFPAGPAHAVAARNTDFNGDGYNDVALTFAYRSSGGIAVLYGGPNGTSGHHLIRPPAGCTTVDRWGSIVPCQSWGLTMAAADANGDGRTDLYFSGLSEAQAMSWQSGGFGTVERHVSTVMYNGRMEIGQFGGQFANDVVMADTVVRGVTPPWTGISGWYDGQGQYKSFPLPDTDVRVTRNEPRHTASGNVDGGYDKEIAIVQARSMREPSTGEEWVEHHLVLADDLEESPVRIIELGSPATCTASPYPALRVCPESDSQVVTGDVNGDKYDDVIMLTPSKRTLHVFYGSSSGPSTVPGFTARDVDWAGGVLWRGVTTGDVNGDGAEDIVLGRPDVGGSTAPAGGAVVLIPGSRNGPAIADGQVITQDGVRPLSGSAPTPLPDPISEQSVRGDAFGAAVSVLDVTGDGKAELITSAPGKNAWQGMLAIVRGTPSGLSATEAQVIHPSQIGIDVETPEMGLHLLR
ncbi:FG-GAP-like repeat-containing protein [Nonomuraea sp. NPDC004354]